VIDMPNPAHWLSRIGLAAGLVVSTGSAFADQAEIDYRQAVMHSIGGHTQALAAIIKGQVPFTEDAKIHARAIEPLATIAGHVFPETSRTGKTEALPAIWEKPGEFKKALGTFQTAAAQLAKVADEAPSAMAGPFSNLAKACKGCHDDFRKKE
jgi:cytochrome c556